MKLLIGGSPCTYWSISQTKNRETEASGMGWELFRNYVIARDKFKPDYFLYENNKSMSPKIRTQITEMLGVEPVLINSALVSAQNRQRLYWVGKRNAAGGYDAIPVEQPEDRGILLRDVLESGVCWREKAYTLRASEGGKTADTHAVRTIATGGKQATDGVAEPLITTPDGKSVTLCGNGGGVGAKTGLYAAPVETPQGMAWRGHAAHGNPSSFEMRKDGKSNAVIVGHQNRLVITSPDGKTLPVYEVRDGLITIKGKQYPIKLRDGCYIIRKLTVTECKRLQTVPEWYVFPVSDSQAYKMLGNGWTVEVIMHLMRHFDGITTEPLDVLSMYDGMACGRIALDNLGANICHYWATEIDKYAIQTATYNFPDIVELGDAFQVREGDWRGVE